MGILQSLLAGPPIAATYQPWDNFWYTRDPRGAVTASGYPANPESAMRIGAVYACVGLLSNMVGTLPLIMYREIDDNERERAKSHPLYKLLRRQPNGRQTAKEWRTLGMNYLLWRGNFYNLIEYDGRFAVRALWPLHPDRVRVTLLDSGRRGYLYRPPRGPERALTADEVLHIMAPVSLDEGVTGCGVLEFARESVGTAGAQEQHAGKTWSDGGEPKSALKRTTPGQPFTREQKQELLQSWKDRAHHAVILEGLDYQPLGLSSGDMQFIEGRKFSVADIARFFGVPPHMIGDVDGSTSWGTGIEQQTMGFVNFTLQPWLEAIVQALDRDVIPEDGYFAEFLMEALLRGDTLARAQAYALNIMNGVMAENEARVRENLKPWPGLWVPRRSANQDRGGDPTSPRPSEAPSPARRPVIDDEDDDEDARAQPAPINARRARGIALEAAERLVRKEIARIRERALKLADDPAAWRAWVDAFYGEHLGLVADTMQLEPRLARAYVEAHRTALREQGVAVIEAWATAAPRELVHLALGDGDDRESLLATVYAAASRPAPTPPAPVTHLTIAPGAIVSNTPVTVPPAPAPVVNNHVDARTTVDAPITVASAPAPAVHNHIDARTEIAEGAVQVPVTVPPGPPPVVNNHVDARTSIAKDAVRVDAPVTATVKTPEPRPMTIRKKVLRRDAAGRPDEVTEQHDPR